MSAVADVCISAPGRPRRRWLSRLTGSSPRSRESATALTTVTAEYQPGQFWRRELPPPRAVLHGVAGLALIVVDGYVDLDPGGRLGLGARVHEEFGVPVIGIAKTFFRGAVHAAPVCRGRPARPMHVTAAGMTVADAAGMVVRMAGPHRFPGAVRLADRLARGLEQPSLRPATRSGSPAIAQPGRSWRRTRAAISPAAAGDVATAGMPSSAIRTRGRTARLWGEPEAVSGGGRRGHRTRGSAAWKFRTGCVAHAPAQPDPR